MQQLKVNRIWRRGVVIMERQFLNYLFVVISVILVTSVHGDDTNNVTVTSEYSVSGHDKMVVCYWGTWANYRPVEGKFTPESVDSRP